MKKQVAHGNKRLINFIIDYIVFPIIVSLLGAFGLFLILGNFLLLETITGKTIGKYFTKTTVVKRDWSKPSFFRILIRMLVRFIPLDVLSYAFSLRPVGWHDAISGTAVVNDIDLLEVKKEEI